MQVLSICLSLFICFSLGPVMVSLCVSELLKKREDDDDDCVVVFVWEGGL